VWHCHFHKGNGRKIDPIECTVDEELSVKITDEEAKMLIDDDKEIRYKKCFGGACQDMVMVMMKNIYLNFKLQGCEII
jgi:hypothetical protein